MSASTAQASVSSVTDVNGAHLTPRQLAEREGVPLQTVYVWNMNGTGPRIMRIGRHVRYRLADVIEWEESQLDPKPAA
ncbi:helix-turn-helix transcriptional regulator [Brevibacterium spongiae]|uniref:Helix-turn-helix domain-containing protein n=1 Tax=Brevibacterium spongiae TaxID=2909672 RepID=A0ABY5SLF3_9MICO|nr:helix-turn-helix domain-containing protein [Brevibacterium spongiae]UVI35000.1 helix-turn-helix domain-containing protein [Brevibacterium spongiae]